MAAATFSIGVYNSLGRVRRNWLSTSSCRSRGARRLFRGIEGVGVKAEVVVGVDTKDRREGLIF
jgi:hypothetical protein